MSIDDNNISLQKALVPIFVKPLVPLTVVNEVLFKNAVSPIAVQLLDNAIDGSFVQPSNAEFPIVFILSRFYKVVNAVQPENVLDNISVSAFKSIETKEEQF